MDFEVMKAYLPRFWDALLLTLRIGWQGVALALALGVACTVAVHWKIPVLRQIVGGYIELFRNTPLLVQLFFLYFALPKIGIRISAETCGKLGLGLLGGAYMAETFRSGLENIPIIQTESAQSLGLRPAQVFGYVILPQAVTSSVPGLLANLIFLLNRQKRIIIRQHFIVRKTFFFIVKHQIVFDILNREHTYNTSLSSLLLEIFLFYTSPDVLRK